MYVGDAPTAEHSVFDSYLKANSVKDELASHAALSVWALGKNSVRSQGGTSSRDYIHNMNASAMGDAHNQYCFQEVQRVRVDGELRIIHERGHVPSEYRQRGGKNALSGKYVGRPIDGPVVPEL